MTTGGLEIELNKELRPVSTFKRLLTKKDENFSSYFDKVS